MKPAQKIPEKVPLWFWLEIFLPVSSLSVLLFHLPILAQRGAAFVRRKEGAPRLLLVLGLLTVLRRNLLMGAQVRRRFLAPASQLRAFFIHCSD